MASEVIAAYAFPLNDGGLIDYIRKYNVAVRCVAVANKRSHVTNGPLWPLEVRASVNNYRDVFRISPGKYGHVRREVTSKCMGLDGVMYEFYYG